MRGLPDTTVRKLRKTGGTWSALLLPVIGAIAIGVLLFAWSVSGRGFSPGEDITSDAVREVAASLEDTAYPPRDILLFEGGPRVVYVYISVSGFDPDTDLSVDVRRSGSESVFGRVFGPDPDIVVSGGGEEQLAASGEGASGVVKFRVSGEGGARLPTGNYTINVSEDGQRAVQKRFIVRE